jgi:membrane protein
LLKKTGANWVDQKDARLGAALAYYSIFSVGPLILIAIAVAGLLFGQEAVRGEVSAQMRSLLGDSGAQAVQSMLADASRPRDGMYATLFGVTTLLFAAVGVVVQLKDALNTVWGVENQKGGAWQLIRTYLVSFAGVMSLGFLLLVSLLVSTALAAGSKYFAPYLPETLLQILTSAVSLGFITVLFAMMFKWLPDTAVAWHDVWIGAAVTAILFEIGKFGIGLYIGKQGLESTFGAAASLVVLLIWVYYSSQIVLMGAEFTRVYAMRRGSLRIQTSSRADRQGQAAPVEPDALRTFVHQSPYGLLVVAAAAGLVMSLPPVQRFLARQDSSFRRRSTRPRPRRNFGRSITFLSKLPSHGETFDGQQRTCG